MRLDAPHWNGERLLVVWMDVRPTYPAMDRPHSKFTLCKPICPLLRRANTALHIAWLAPLPEECIPKNFHAFLQKYFLESIPSLKPTAVAKPLCDVLAMIDPLWLTRCSRMMPGNFSRWIVCPQHWYHWLLVNRVFCSLSSKVLSASTLCRQGPLHLVRAPDLATPWRRVLSSAPVHSRDSSTVQGHKWHSCVAAIPLKPRTISDAPA